MGLGDKRLGCINEDGLPVSLTAPGPALNLRLPWLIWVEGRQNRKRMMPPHWGDQPTLPPLGGGTQI